MTPSGRGSRRRGRGKKKRTRSTRATGGILPEAVVETGCLVVHAPTNLTEASVQKTFIAACSGKRVGVPNLQVKVENDGTPRGGRPYLVVGPDPRYYVACPACFGEVGW